MYSLTWRLLSPLVCFLPGHEDADEERYPTLGFTSKAFVMPRPLPQPAPNKSPSSSAVPQQVQEDSVPSLSTQT